MWDLQMPETNRPWPSCRHEGSMSTHTVRTAWDQMLGMNARLHTSFQFRTSWGKCLTMTGRTNIKKDALLVGRQEMMLSGSAQCGCCCSPNFYFNKLKGRGGGGGWMRTEAMHKSQWESPIPAISKIPCVPVQGTGTSWSTFPRTFAIFSEQSALPRNDRTFQGTKRADQVLSDMALTGWQNI